MGYAYRASATRADGKTKETSQYATPQGCRGAAIRFLTAPADPAKCGGTFDVSYRISRAEGGSHTGGMLTGGEHAIVSKGGSVRH